MAQPDQDGLVAVPACVVCGGSGVVEVEPSRRTMARGADPADPGYSTIVVLPDIALCEEHAVHVRSGDVSIGWCDDEQCRRFGEVGGPSPCGTPYNKLRR